MTLGQRIAFYRKKQSLTQAGLGEQLSISAQAISKWENDQAEPDVATLIQLSKILNVPLDELLMGEAPTPAAPATTKEPAAAEPAPKSEKAPSPVKKIWKGFCRFIGAHKRLLIALLALIILFTVPTAIFLPHVLPAIQYETVSVGMDIEKVEKLLGAPHRVTLTKSIGGETYEDDGSFGSSISEGFMEGLLGEEAVVEGGTYVYYYGPYGRTVKKINKLNKRLDRATNFSRVMRLSDKIAKLESDLHTLDNTKTLKVFFEGDQVTEVSVKANVFNQRFKRSKK